MIVKFFNTYVQQCRLNKIYTLTVWSLVTTIKRVRNVAATSVTRVIQWAFSKLSNKVQLSIDHHQNKDLLLAWLFACALLHHHLLMLIANDTYTQNW